MNYSFDTNIFINSLIYLEYRKEVDEFFVNKHSFIPRSLLKELYQLNRISEYISKIKQLHEDTKKEIKEVIKHPSLASYNKKYSNIKDYVVRAGDNGISIVVLEERMNQKVNDIISQIGNASRFRKKFIHPGSDEEIGRILNVENSRFEALSKIGDNDDIIHLIICESYATGVIFVSDDKHIISNKGLITKILKRVRASSFKEFREKYSSIFYLSSNL